MTADPFDTAALRDAVVQAWRASPTRFTEDANSEEDLRIGGYADRLFVELAQNAADAATLAGVPGRVRVSVVDSELRVANTGATLDADGVAALASLRASAKRGGVTVGRFGVGFAAVLAVSSEPRVVSRTGGVAFSEALTRDVVSESPELADQVRRRDGAVPVLRLPWPTDETPPEGFDTEVRLPLRPDVDVERLLADITAEIDDVLLTLPALTRVELPDAVWTRSGPSAVSPVPDVVSPVPDVVAIARDGEPVRRWLVRETSGDFTAAQVATLGIEAVPRWTALWALPVDVSGAPCPLERDVLHAPTATDERMTLPARLIASVPVEPSRRRVLAGPAVSAVLAAAAESYLDLVRSVAPAERLALVPSSGFPASDVDATLREEITERLRTSAWLPRAGGGELSGAEAKVLDVDLPDLGALLGEVLSDMAAPLGPGALRPLAPLGVTTLTVADAVDGLAGITRPVGWWRELYDVLTAALDAHAVSADALSGLPVPLIDGRLVTGVRGVLLPEVAEQEVLELLAEADVVGLHVADPDVAHPLLRRIGADVVDAPGLLSAPALRAAVERSVPDASAGMDVGALVRLVLRLVSDSSGGSDPGWLGALALPASDGGWRRADELLLPSSPLLDVFADDAIGDDAALDVVDKDFAARWPVETLRMVGVLDTFAVVSDPEPVEPDHDLPDEREWWDARAEVPATLLAVRDLDLVDDDAWPAALRLLSAQRETWEAVTAPGGHTGWWLARFAVLGGHAPCHWRLPECEALAGLYDSVPDVGLSHAVLAAAGVRDSLDVSDADDAEDLLDRLADPSREPRQGVVLRAHAALAALPPGAAAAVSPPDAVRVLDGSVVDADAVGALDAPWLVGVVDPATLVAADTVAVADALADVLDVPLASERAAGVVVSSGELIGWSELSAVCVVAELLGLDVPEGGVGLHPGLEVRLHGAGGATVSASWWVDDDGVLHADDSEPGLARAFAHATDRWDLRHLIEALLADPTATTLLA
ncbi:sacsin N-terminal ATP-binding-like domain-containing protein [Haloechinothrix salitolerans]|uniref:Sacsin N-terminal ATP-binding-like domain-containing protein n=1 Tax=Haloechinothrix salitolerans TaxID=926830 RepID=A0ABW2BVB6_9PSEU